MSIPHFHFLTLFPDAIRIWLTTSILGRAHANGLFEFTLHQLRDYSNDKHRSVDDVAYGGGGGMVFRIEPLVAAVEAIHAKVGEQATVIAFSPGGRRLATPVLEELRALTCRHLILVCGHYEGIDQRFLDNWVDREISLGDFVLTGGELPAVAMADAWVRHLEGALGADQAADTESFSLRHPTDPHARLLEYPHYTRPSEFRGHRVPEILLSGDHGRVAEWRTEMAMQRTNSQRPDLIPSLNRD